jgi:hypothetical protein
MGSPISSILADIVMSEVDTQAVRMLSPNIRIWERFVDDVFSIMKRRNWKRTLEMLNCINKDTQFTIEMEQDQKLPFLDLEFTRRGTIIDSKVYRKPTHSGSYTFYTSEHAHSHKMSVINALAYRAMKYCNSVEKQEEELELIARELRNNGYPSTENCSGK